MCGKLVFMTTLVFFNRVKIEYAIFDMASPSTFDDICMWPASQCMHFIEYSLLLAFKVQKWSFYMHAIVLWIIYWVFLLVWRAMISHTIKNFALLYNHLPKQQLRFQTNWAILQYKTLHSWDFVYYGTKIIHGQQSGTICENKIILLTLKESTLNRGIPQPTLLEWREVCKPFRHT